MIIADHTSPTIHHFVLAATSSIVVLRKNQCDATIRTVITDTLIMLNVCKTATPLLCPPNIEKSKSHAVVKSGERKNTQVTLIRKNVSKAQKKFCTSFLLKNAGANDAVVIT